MLTVVRLVQLRSHRCRVVPSHDRLLVLAVSSMVLLCVAAVRGVRWVSGLILFQFVISGREFVLSDVRRKPLDIGKGIRNRHVLSLLLLVLRVIRDALTRIEVLIWWSELRCHSIEISDIS